MFHAHFLITYCIFISSIMVIGYGETVYDIIFKGDQPQKAVPGGSTFNALVSLGRSGVPCIMITETGDDHIGDIVSGFLLANGIGTDYVYRYPGTKSHLSLAFLDENNDAQYQFYKDHANIAEPQTMPHVEKGDIVLFGSFYCINPKIRRYSHQLLQMAQDKGAFLYYDINFRASHVADIPDVLDNIHENMSLASVVRGSSEDFQLLYGASTCDEAYDVVKQYCPNLIYTDAAKPIQLRTQQLNMSFPVPPIKTVSTVGAGDNFNAGFCCQVYNDGYKSVESIVTELQWSRCIAKGLEYSAIVCQSLDNYIPKP